MTDFKPFEDYDDKKAHRTVLAKNHLILWWTCSDYNNLAISYDSIKYCNFDEYCLDRQPVEIQNATDPYAPEVWANWIGMVTFSTKYDGVLHCNKAHSFITSAFGYKLFLDKLADSDSIDITCDNTREK